jgi:hypothetical protein
MPRVANAKVIVESMDMALRDLKFGQYAITKEGDVFFKGVWETVCLTNPEYGFKNNPKKGSQTNAEWYCIPLKPGQILNLGIVTDHAACALDLEEDGADE